MSRLGPVRTTLIQLPEADYAAIEQIVQRKSRRRRGIGSYGVSTWIREAVQERLKRELGEATPAQPLRRGQFADSAIARALRGDLSGFNPGL